MGWFQVNQKTVIKGGAPEFGVKVEENIYVIFLEKMEGMIFSQRYYYSRIYSFVCIGEGE